VFIRETRPSPVGSATAVISDSTTSTRAVPRQAKAAVFPVIQLFRFGAKTVTAPLALNALEHPTGPSSRNTRFLILRRRL